LEESKAILGIPEKANEAIDYPSHDRKPYKQAV
jgi:hypothetical protein